MGRHWGLRVIFYLVLGFISFSAAAHIPMMEQKDSTGFKDAVKIPKPGVSRAIYANLDSAADVDYYSFELSKPMTGHVSLLVPYLPGYEDFYPLFAVVGPGLPPAEINLPFEVPPNYGAVVQHATGAAPRPTFFEPFSRKNYYRGMEEFKQELVQPGTYYIVVWHPAGEYGAYILGYGDKEWFSLRDWANTFKLLPAIRSDSWVGKRGKPSSPVPANRNCGCGRQEQLTK